MPPSKTQQSTWREGGRIGGNVDTHNAQIIGMRVLYEEELDGSRGEHFLLLGGWWGVGKLL